MNRNEYDVSGSELEVPNKSGMHFYDLWHGSELTATIANGKAILSFDLEGLGYGTILATEERPSESVQNLLSYMAERSRRPLSSYTREWKFVPQTLVEISPPKAVQSPPSGWSTSQRETTTLK